MTDESRFRDEVHRAVNACTAAAHEDPFLLQHVLARADRKEEPRMKKKLSTAAILVIALLLLSVAALAVGLTVEEVWKQSFDRMNTVGIIYSEADGTQAEISLEEAISIARGAIIAKYGTPESELDEMGLYPSYYPRGWDGMTDDYPSEWTIYYSSRRDVYLDEDYSDYGPTGEYRVYINAETREVTYCHWYTNDFWSRAQTIWDCGSHDEVSWWYGRPDYFALPPETQAYWTQQLAAKGYDVITADEQLHEALSAASTNLQFLTLDTFADENDPQVIAAWAALEEQGYDTALLRRYAYVATRPDWQTGTDNVCIHYSFEKEWDLMSKGLLEHLSDRMFSYVRRLGLFAVSFRPGTTEVAAVTHLPHSNDAPTTDEVLLLARQNWTQADLPVFDEAFRRLDRGVKRMQAAGMAQEEQETIVRDYLFRLGGEYVGAAPEGVDVQSWFAAQSEWDALVREPAMTYEEYIAAYGINERLWPMEVLCELRPESYRMPNPGETTLEEAAAIGLEAAIGPDGEEMRAILADYHIVVHRVSLTDDPAKVDCRWEVCIVQDLADPTVGFKVQWGEWEDHTGTPTVQDINDRGNG
ncbi:MAG: hypothetical protein IJ343_10590 [Clostridia bacterium]|nr:hypothetical protein [Clostridia bacterium]